MGTRSAWKRAVAGALVAAALVPASCDDSQNTGTPDMQGTSTPDLVAPCAACAEGEVCRGDMIYYPWPKQCIRTCSVTDDCRAGEHCVHLIGTLSDPPLCVSETIPQMQPGGICDHFGSATCLGDILARPIWLQGGALCGEERVRCAGGCEVVPVDGGISSTEARCREGDGGS